MRRVRAGGMGANPFDPYAMIASGGGTHVGNNYSNAELVVPQVCPASRVWGLTGRLRGN